MERHKITSCETYMVDAQSCNYLFVELKTDTGLVGLGEATMQFQSRTVASAIDHMFERYVIGSDPFEIERAVALMYRNDYGRGGPALNSAVAGIELAMWDIVGKILGQPVHRLLGGAVRSEIAAYANGWFFGAETPKDWAECAAKVHALGYRAMKFDPYWPVGREPSEQELRKGSDIVQAIREAVGPDSLLLIDAHGRFSVGAAARVANDLAQFGVHWLEEPVDPENHAAIGRVPRVGGMRIASGERCWSRYQVPSLLEHGRVEVLQPDVVQSGGILEARKIAAIADAHYIPVSFHNVFGPVSAAATLQVDACTTNVYMQETFADFVGELYPTVVDGAPMPVDGKFVFSDAPGLGVKLNKDVVEKYPYNAGAMVELWDGIRDF